MPDYFLYFDGSCTPNPGGIATYSYVLEKDEGKIGTDVVFSDAKILGEGEGMTCNLAEYKGLHEGLRYISNNFEKLKPTKITVRGDSQLVINQSSGKWKVNADNLKTPSADTFSIVHILSEKCQVVFEWIPREQNKLADKLTQKAYENSDFVNSIKLDNKDLKPIWIWDWDAETVVLSQSENPPYDMTIGEMKENDVQWFFAKKDTIMSLIKSLGKSDAVVLGCNDCPNRCREYIKPGDRIFMFCSAQGEYGKGDWRICEEK